MKNISSACKNAILKGAYQNAEITVSPLEGETFTLYNKDVALGGLKIERQSVDCEGLQVGNFWASKLTLTLDNFDGRFNSVFFGGAVLTVKIGIECEGENLYTEHIPMGKFTVNEQPRKLSSISLTAYDFALQLDKPFPVSESEKVISRRDLARELVEHCGLICNDYSLFDDSAEALMTLPAGFGNDLLCRQALMHLCEIEGINGFTDGEGYVSFKWYGSEPFTVDESLRYSSDTEERPVTVNGVRFAEGENFYPFDISGDYLIEIKENPLFAVSDNKTAAAERANERVRGFTYLGYKCECRSLPFLEPMDSVKFVKSGTEYDSVITNTVFVLNGKTSLAAKCVSLTEKNLAPLGALTAEQRAIIKGAVKAETKSELSGMENALLDLNSLQANSNGYYLTRIPQHDGSVKIYQHDKPLLEESEFISTNTSAGYAYTRGGWNGGNPIWTYGHDSYGNAVLNAIHTNKLNADDITTGRMQSHDGETYIDLDNGYSKLKGSMKIAQDGYDGYMNLQADEIANYFEGKKTFFLNKDETEIEKLISRKQIDMEPIKIIPIITETRRGWAFVKLGGD